MIIAAISPKKTPKSENESCLVVLFTWALPFFKIAGAYRARSGGALCEKGRYPAFACVPSVASADFRNSAIERVSARGCSVRAMASA